MLRCPPNIRTFHRLKSNKEKVNLLFETLMQVDDVVLLELAEHLNLAHRGLLHDLIVVRLLEFLNRN